MFRGGRGTGRILAATTVCLGVLGAGVASAGVTPSTAGLRVSGGDFLNLYGDYNGPVANEIDATLSGGTFTVTDTAGAARFQIPQNPCQEISATQVDCPGALTQNLIQVDANEMNDSVTLSGAPGHDAIVNLGPGSDEFQGGPEADNVFGYWSGGQTPTDGLDTIRLGAGNDFATGDFGPSYGGAGPDDIHGEGGDDLLMGDAGDDLLYGGDDADTLAGDFEYDDPDAAAGNPNPPGQDTLDGGEGDDVIFAGPGEDIVIGGPGKDVVYSEEEGEAADDVSCGEGDLDIAAFGENDLVASDCEIVFLAASCPPNQECEALLEVSAELEASRRAGGQKKLVLASGKFKFKRSKKLKVKFKPAKVDRVLDGAASADVVRKFTIKSKRKKKKTKSTRFELTASG